MRLFVGLELSAEIKKSLEFARGGVEGARWQRDDQLHLTLGFIGEVPMSSVREIERVLADIHFDPFELQLTGVDMFGSVQQPKTLWAGVADEKSLKYLHEKILNALERVGIEGDRRRFKPHVTLARFNRGVEARISDWLGINGTLKTPVQTVEYFSLFSSAPTSEGPSYIVEARFGDGAAETSDEGSGFVPVFSGGLAADVN